MKHPEDRLFAFSHKTGKITKDINIGDIVVHMAGVGVIINTWTDNDEFKIRLSYILLSINE